LLEASRKSPCWRARRGVFPTGLNAVMLVGYERKTGGCLAEFASSFGRGGNRLVCRRVSRRQQSHPTPLGAEFDHDQLHDDLQLPGGKLSNDLCGAACRTDQLSSRGRYAASEQHHHRKPIVSEQLLVTAAFVPYELRADIALSVMRCPYLALSFAA